MSIECSGKLTANGVPSSCTDLWQIGHSLSGLYSVMGTKLVETLYCDFSKLSSEPGFQTRIGYVDVKSLSVYFFVQRSSSFSTLNTPIPYNTIRLNIGGAMDAASGVFTAPRPGRYFFAFTSEAFRTATSWCWISVSMRLNDNHIGMTRSEGANNNRESISFQSTLDLKTGDRVWCQIVALSNTYLYSDDGNTLFTGWLLQEDLSLQ